MREPLHNSPLHNSLKPGAGDEVVDPSTLTRAGVIRAWADGEIGDEDAARAGVDIAAGSGDRGSASFEGQLRGGVRRAMGGVTAPQGLRDRVLAAVAAADNADEAALAAGLEARAEQTRSASFWSRNGRLVGAVAAVLVVGMAGVFLAATLGPGAGLSSGGGLAGGSVTDGGLAYRYRLASFVAKEHHRTAESERAASGKFYLETTDAARTALDGKFGRRVVLPDCKASGLAFRGCGDCNVPGTGSSSHAQFVVPSAEGDRLVSLFVCDDDGGLGLEPGTLYEVDREACGLGSSRVYLWSADGLMYCLVTEADPDGRACRTLMDLMRAPTDSTLL